LRDELAWGSIAQSAVRMPLVTMGEPAGQLVDDTLRIWPGVHADIIALEGANERLGHAIRLRTADWGRARDQSNAPGERPCVASGVGVGT
jgi:hypothetical protein